MKKYLLILLLTTNCFADPATEPAQFSKQLIDAAIERTQHNVRYDGSYVRIPYPNGDVSANTGVCTDVVIRSYRKLGIDLQRDVHEDMKRDFTSYPPLWNLRKPDSNIDHRRVPNLQTLFKRHGIVLPVTNSAEDYRPGDLVTWMLPGNLPHIGIVTDRFSADKKRPLLSHNIGRGPQLEDMLFQYPITGHYRYYGKQP